LNVGSHDRRSVCGLCIDTSLQGGSIGLDRGQRAARRCTACDLSEQLRQCDTRCSPPLAPTGVEPDAELLATIRKPSEHALEVLENTCLPVADARVVPGQFAEGQA